jgi:hypothetical protein
MISPICISTVHGKGLRVMLASIAEYCPEVPVYLRGPESVIGGFDTDLKIFGAAHNFGDDYNHVMDRAFADGFDSVICANDDIVLTPTSYKDLLEDVRQLKADTDDPVGWVSARCDAARPGQNIRSNPFDEKLDYFRYPYEDAIVEMKVVSPIFAWINRDAWDCFKFPPLNWYSDDVHCEDLRAAGFSNYLSTSYVHHIGSQTIGLDGEKLTKAAIPWLLKNRPHYAQEWFK